jgi:ribosomal protein S17E
MSQELAELRQTILNGRYDEALAMVDELEQMSRKAIIRNIRAYLVRLLSHLIKNQVEQRLTNSWAASIRHSVREIQDLNQREHNRTHYISVEEWPAYLDDAFEDALYTASDELAKRIDQQQVDTIALAMLADTYTCTRQELSARINAQLGGLPGGQAWQGGT